MSSFTPPPPVRKKPAPPTKDAQTYSNHHELGRLAAVKPVSPMARRALKSLVSTPLSSSLFSPSAMDTTTPTPIPEPTAHSRYDSRKRNLELTAFSDEFSQQVKLNEGKPKKSFGDESDTDVGSSAGDESFNFDCEDDLSEAHTSMRANLDTTPETGNSKFSMTRVGAKVRRLHLTDGSKLKLFDSGSTALHNLSSNPDVLQPKSLSSGHKVLIQGLNQEHSSDTRLRSSVLSPSKSSPDVKKSRMFRQPPSTIKKGTFSRTLLRKSLEKSHDDSFDSCLESQLPPKTSHSETSTIRLREEDDVSPRDPSNFPFFVHSPIIGNKKWAAVGIKNSTPGDTSLNSCEPDHGTTSYAEPNTADQDTSISSPRMPRKFSRANSFLQMFSQKPLVVSAMDESDDDDFLKRHSYDENIEISKHNLRAARRLVPEGYESSHSFDLSPTQPDSSPFSRFLADFEIVGTLGNGSFGCVYKVRSRIDRRMYAIKAAKREARGKTDRDRMLQEVFALAALSDKTTAAAMHIVRYHQAWMEGNRLYIQTELCDGNLQMEMSQGLMNEKRRYKVLREMLLALDLVHESGMIHLDIKPENIFIKNDQYKLGDFGLVSEIENHDDVEEGDSRYMSMELLSGDLNDLTKSDIFSLGVTMYEICIGKTLPENGQEWQDMRRGILLPMPNTASELQMIIKEMMAPESQCRPAASELLKKRQLLSDEQRELIVERNKVTAANRALDAQMQRFQLMSPRRNFHRSNTVS